MPNKYDVSEKSIKTRNKILAICRYEPKSIKEIADLFGTSSSAMRFNVNELIESRHLKIGGKKLDGNKQPCAAYISVELKYNPNQQRKASVVHADKSKVRMVSSDDYHTTRSLSRKQNVWIGSTFSTMTF
jgi:predicted transcriptional regulator